MGRQRDRVWPSAGAGSASLAMMLAGHKTRAVFECYNIVSEQDLREVGRS